ISTSLFPDTSRMALKKATSFEAAFDIPCLAETLAAEVGVRIRLQLAGDGLDGVDADLLLLSGRKAVILLDGRSEEHTSELQSLMRISYAVFCLNKKKQK